MTGDWADFAQTMFATFVGFLLSILASLWVYRKTQKEDREKDEREVISGITTEFDYIIEQVLAIEKKELKFSPIETPFWHSIVTGARLSLINNKKCFKNIASVYAKVDEINTWSRIKTERYIEIAGSTEEEKYAEEEENADVEDNVIQQIKSIIEKERICNEPDRLFYLIENAKRELK